jgi:putative oxidoreductase
MHGDAHDDPRGLHKPAAALPHVPSAHAPAVPRSSRFRDAGLLILRVGIGAFFVGHGLPKIVGGPTRWAELGEAVGNLGIHLGRPAMWGFAAALSELLGGLLLATGVLFRTACFFLFATMCVATVSHVSKLDDFESTAHAAEMAILFVSLLLIGPGPWRIRLGR